SYGRPLPMIFAAMQDKDIDGLIRALAPAASAIICTRAQSPRAARPEQLARTIESLAPGLPVFASHTPAEALAAAAALGQPIVVAGSLYLAGEIRDLLS
nr:bifunctional folylpolyglutamate synthase/dihydrofolate synthase [Acidobacteriota bacterium]